MRKYSNVIQITSKVMRIIKLYLSSILLLSEHPINTETLEPQLQ